MAWNVADNNHKSVLFRVETLQFCLCIGDDTSDESMYSAVLDFMGQENMREEREEKRETGKKELGKERFGSAFTCTVGTYYASCQ